MLAFLATLLHNSWALLRSISCWMIISYTVSGFLHNFLRPETLQKNLGNKKLSSRLAATVSGALLPICSCGVVPLGLSLYYSGAYLGNVLAFMTSTPIINPSAVLIAWATLGKELALIHIAAGIVIPLIIGTIANHLAKEELVYPKAVEVSETVTKSMSLPLKEKILFGLKWGFGFLGKEISKSVIPGIVLASLLLTVVPASFIQKYLSSPDMVSILGIALLSTVMYVCSVGHIPFVAALIGAGASPGIAITFLITGTATNLPELMSIFNLMGKKAAIIYTSFLAALSMIVGYLINVFLTDFVPVFDISVNQGKLDLAEKLSIHFPPWAEIVCSLLIIALYLSNYYPTLQEWVGKLFSGRKSHEEV